MEKKHESHEHKDNEHKNHEHKGHEHKSHEHKAHTKHHTKKKDFSKWTIVLSIIAIIVIALLIINIGKILPSGDQNANVLAKVNGEDIYVDELDSELKKLPEYYQQVMDPLTLKKNVLEQLVMKKLLLQEADKLKLKVSQEEIDKEVEATYTKFGLTKGDFLVKLEEQGTNYEEFVVDFKEQLLLNKLIESALLKGEPDEKDLQAHYDENKDTLVSAMASHILVCYTGTTSCQEERTEEEALAIVDEILGKIENGDDFAELAKEYSDGPSGPLGGSLGWFNKGAMVPEFELATFELNKGETSEGVKTDFGYHVIFLEDKKESFEELKEDISAEIKNTELQANIGTYLDSLKDQSEIEYVTPLELLEPVEDATDDTVAVEGITTFLKGDDEICRDEDGKPLVFMFSTTWCPHCQWAEKPFNTVAKEYQDKGLITAYHWEIDINDDTLTEEEESSIPEEHMAIMKKFNPQGSIPTFVFGCKYYRIGAGHEQANDKEAEAAEHRLVIEELLSGEVTSDEAMEVVVEEVTVEPAEETTEANTEETAESEE